jgi:uncharacterized membrane protein YkvA (DUF1232 family)
VFILGAFAYFFWRSDMISDFLPVIGYADDVAALLEVVSTVSCNVTPSVEAEAKMDYEVYFDEGSDAAI